MDFSKYFQRHREQYKTRTNPVAGDLRKRVLETNTKRKESRHGTLNTKRKIPENMSPINSPGTKNVEVAKPPSKRLEMLAKWKEEKQKRKEIEKKNQKPIFRVTHVPINLNLDDLENANKMIKGKPIKTLVAKSKIAPDNHQFRPPANLKPIPLNRCLKEDRKQTKKPILFNSSETRGSKQKKVSIDDGVTSPVKTPSGKKIVRTPYRASRESGSKSKVKEKKLQRQFAFNLDESEMETNSEDDAEPRTRFRKNATKATKSKAPVDHVFSPRRTRKQGKKSPLGNSNRKVKTLQTAKWIETSYKRSNLIEESKNAKIPKGGKSTLKDNSAPNDEDASTNYRNAASGRIRTNSVEEEEGRAKHLKGRKRDNSGPSNLTKSTVSNYNHTYSSEEEEGGRTRKNNQEASDSDKSTTDTLGYDHLDSTEEVVKNSKRRKSILKQDNSGANDLDKSTTDEDSPSDRNQVNSVEEELKTKTKNSKRRKSIFAQKKEESGSSDLDKSTTDGNSASDYNDANDANSVSDHNHSVEEEKESKMKNSKRRKSMSQKKDNSGFDKSRTLRNSASSINSTEKAEKAVKTRTSKRNKSILKQEKNNELNNSTLDASGCYRLNSTEEEDEAEQMKNLKGRLRQKHDSSGVSELDKSSAEGDSSSSSKQSKLKETKNSKGRKFILKPKEVNSASSELDKSTTASPRITGSDTRVGDWVNVEKKSEEEDDELAMELDEGNIDEKAEIANEKIKKRNRRKRNTIAEVDVVQDADSTSRSRRRNITPPSEGNSKSRRTRKTLESTKPSDESMSEDTLPQRKLSRHGNVEEEEHHKTPDKKSLLKSPKSESHETSTVFETPHYVSPFVTIGRGKHSAKKEQEMRKLRVPDQSSSPEAASAYFFSILSREIARLRELCNSWDSLRENGTVPEEANDMINAAIGQTNLFINKRCVAFRELIVECANRNEFTEKPVLCEDLHAYWDVCNGQIEDLDLRFNRLEKMKDNNWVEILPEKRVVRPKKKTKVAKKVVASSRLKDAIKAARLKNNQKNNSNELEASEVNADLTKFVSPRLSSRTPRQSLLKQVLSTETKRKSSPGLVMMKVSQLAKNIQTPTPNKGILKMEGSKSAANKSKVVLFKDNTPEGCSDKENDFNFKNIEDNPGLTPAKRSSKRLTRSKLF